MSRAETVRALTPPIFWRFAKRRLPWLVRAFGGHYTHIRFHGDFPDFETARRACKGYDDPSILERTRGALLKVKRGEAKWEQDAMVSDSEELPWPLLAALLRVIAEKGNRQLRVLDFGGSLGSLYYWCHLYLPPEIELRWHVVEQPAHVEVGRRDFQDDRLRFDFSVEEVLAQGMPDVLLLSGVLHFLPEPEKFVEKMAGWRIPRLIIDRTMLWDHDRHRLTVQEVPPEIYPASYPAWFLSRRRIFALLEGNYQLTQRVPGTETWELDRDSVISSQWHFTLRHTP